MIVSILSKESVKPWKLARDRIVEPLKLNLLDQLTPSSYTPLILFYNNSNNRHIANQLKSSLSKALSIYYPLAGRVRDNYAIHDFNQGVPFLETHVDCCLSDFLHHGGGSGSNGSGSTCLNNFLPFPTFCRAPEGGPQIGVQLNVFQCGGLALGVCFSHKTHDGASVSGLLNTWAAINADRGLEALVQPNFREGPSTFPPVESMPRHYASLTEALWFRPGGGGGNPVMTRAFGFCSDSVGRLRARARARTELAVRNPSRTEALSAFMWKSLMRASGSAKPSVLTQSVNLRRRMTPPLCSRSFGNLILFSDAKSSSSSEEEEEAGLASIIRSGVAEIDGEYIKTLSGEKGREAIFEYYDKQAEIEGCTDVFNFTCWHGFEFSKTDFGLGCGPTVWVGLSGVGSGGGGRGDDAVPYCSNSVVLIEDGTAAAGGRDGMVAWVTMEEPIMSALERDPDFLKFASPKFPISPY